MSKPVQITTEAMFAEIGRLQMECKLRAARELELEAEIASLKVGSAEEKAESKK